MAKNSAGIVLYRIRERGLEILLVHPGGPFWAKKDHGAWSIPKGEFEPPEDPLAAARREFREETGYDVSGETRKLAPQKQPSGKTVHAWAVQGDLDASRIESNLFTMEWPRGSGRERSFPEVDRAEWFPLDEARRRALPGHVPILDELAAALGFGSSGLLH